MWMYLTKGKTFNTKTPRHGLRGFRFDQFLVLLFAELFGIYMVWHVIRCRLPDKVQAGFQMFSAGACTYFSS